MKAHLFQKFIFSLLVAGMLIFPVFNVSAISLTLTEVQNYIAENNLDWQAGETSISRLSDAEFQSMLGLIVPDDYVPPPDDPSDGKEPFDGRSRWDWREHNGVTPAKSQGNCGSCWAFATTGMVESFVLIYDNILMDLSEQQLISCNTAGYGCNGGWLYPRHYQNPGGIYESCMPYQASDYPQCIENQCEKVAIIDGWNEIGTSVNSIKNALVDGPVAAAMEAYNDLSYYTGGCYSHGYTSSVNHGILIVGYDDNDCSGQGAWIVKNSWGPNWGENGFFRIKYGDCNIGYGATRIYYSPSTSVNLAFGSYTVDDSIGGDGNGLPEPGETVRITVRLGNTGNTTATGVGAVLSCSNSNVTISDNFATFPDIPAGQQRDSVLPGYTVSFNPGMSQGTTVVFQLAITADQGSYSASFPMQVGEIYTNTPCPTSTPIPTWTPVPPTPTPPEGTPVPTHTVRPTATSRPPGTGTPPATPTATPTFFPDTDKIVVNLILSKHTFHTGDLFELKYIVDNYGLEIPVDQYLVLSVYDNFWFYPTWLQDIDKRFRTYPTGRTSEIILRFNWPRVDGSAGGLTFYGFLCSPGTFNIISNIATASFGYE